MTIREIFLDDNYNCAEAVLLWANERYGLNVAPEDVRLVLSKALVQDRAHTTPGFREACAGLVDRFRADLGSIECTELKEKYRRPDVRCLCVVERAAAILDEYMQTLEETP